MKERTRRDVLKKGSIITGGLLISGQVSAKSPKPDKSKYSFTLRRGRSGKPIKPSKIEKRRNKIIEKYPFTGDENGGQAGLRTPAQLAENEEIIAYNFDMIEGSPHEYVGIYEKNKESEEVPGQKVSEIHKNADKHAMKRRVKKTVPPGHGGER